MYPIFWCILTHFDTVISCIKNQMSFTHFSPNFRQLLSSGIIYKNLKRRNSSFSPENVFSDDNIKKAISKFSSMKPFRFQTRQPVKKSAFFIPLCEVGDQVCLLFTIRANHIKKFGGQVSKTLSFFRLCC